MFRALIEQVLLTWRLIRDPRVPLWTKVVPFLGLAYVLSPIDIIPDLLIGLGQLDDLGIILAGMRLFESIVPDYLVTEHRQQIARRNGPLETIDATNYTVTRETKEKPKRG